MTPDKLKEIEARAAAATPGPWTTIHPLLGGSDIYAMRRDIHDRSGHLIGQIDSAGCRQNAEFIAAARADVPDLCASLREAWAREEALETAVAESLIFQAEVRRLEALLHVTEQHLVVAESKTAERDRKLYEARAQEIMLRTALECALTHQHRGREKALIRTEMLKNLNVYDAAPLEAIHAVEGAAAALFYGVYPADVFRGCDACSSDQGWACVHEVPILCGCACRCDRSERLVRRMRDAIDHLRHLFGEPPAERRP